MKRTSNSVRAVALGNAIRQPLETVNSKYSKEAREEFLRWHDKLTEAASGVDSVEVAVSQANSKVDAAAEAQNARTLALADVLSGDGFGRLRPFESFGADSPSELRARRPADSARALISLVNKVLVHPKASAASKKAATAMRDAALTLQRVDGELTMALDARVKAVKARNQLVPQWQKALSRLRAAIRFGDFEEDTQHYETVFRRVAREAAVSPKRKQAVVVPDALPGGPVS